MATLQARMFTIIADAAAAEADQTKHRKEEKVELSGKENDGRKSRIGGGYGHDGI